MPPDFDRLSTYHIVFYPLLGTLDYSSDLKEPEILENVRRYVALGKLYVTDWSGEFADAVFPRQMQLTPGEDTPPEAYDPVTNTWNTDLFGDSNGLDYDTNNAEVTDPVMAEWMRGQSGPRYDEIPVRTTLTRLAFKGHGIKFLLSMRCPSVETATAMKLSMCPRFG